MDEARAPARHPDHISQEQLIEEMNAALTYPGVSNAWTMPIKGRVDMLTTGIRTPVGLKISAAISPRSRRSAGRSRRCFPR
jgi:Cu/Ag efflux pump CusA